MYAHSTSFALLRGGKDSGAEWVRCLLTRPSPDSNCPVRPGGAGALDERYLGAACKEP